MHIRRRGFLAGAAALASTRALAATLPITVAVGGGRQPLTVRVTHAAGTTTYSEATGRDLGTYVGKGVSQRSILCPLDPALPAYSVQVRPETDGSREEVVLELGDIWTRGSAPFSMGSHKVEVLRGSQLLSSTSLPAHYFRSRWRWQSTPRPVQTTAAALIAAGLLPRYDESLTAGFTPASGAAAYTPMGLAGLAGDMRGTGERPEIGPVTEPQADWICTGRASALSTLFAQAEASGTFPWHFRDERTGATLDCAVNKQASQYQSSGPSPNLPRDFALDGKVVCDPAHAPALTYLPFLLTGDPYWLEEMQNQVAFNILTQPWNGRAFDIFFAIRAHAWALRTAAQTALVTPDVVPSWLQPRSYFKAHLDANRDWMLATYVNNPKAPWSTFRTTEQTFGDNDEAPAAPAGTYSQTYMEEFEAFIFGWVVRMGFADWRPIFEWKIQNTIARTNGTSGWIRAVSTPYRQLMRASRADPWLPDWATSWALTQSRYPTIKFTDPNALSVVGNDISYPGYTLGALAMADSLGVAAARAPHLWMAGELRRLQNAQRFLARKWCVS